MTDETVFPDTSFGARKSAYSESTSKPGQVVQARARPQRKLKIVQELPPPKSPITIYAQILRWSFGATLALMAVVVLLIYVTRMDGETPFYPVAVLAGALGAFLSSLIRLYSDNEYPKLLNSGALRELKRSDLVVYALVPPIVGVLSAGATAGLGAGIPMIVAGTRRTPRGGGGEAYYEEARLPPLPAGPRIGFSVALPF